MKSIEQVLAWWDRIQYETPPFAWRSDPKLDGITEPQFRWLRDLDEQPTAEQVAASSLF